MGYGGHNGKDLESTEYRRNTYREITLPSGFNIDLLAEAGFYFTHCENYVKCFKCNLDIDLSQTDPYNNLIELHNRLNSECTYAKNKIESTARQPNHRSKTFLSYNSLRYECERLETFIDWPVSFMKPEELAADGFFYLRTADHCACIFCRGIVGAWEEGDTPRGEHEQHFSHCPFIRGQLVENVPISESNLPGSYPECRKPTENIVNLKDIDVSNNSAPKHLDFLTTINRLQSFSKWPERVPQQPVVLAEAGFFYCGLSDHVRCFYCGNGLRNWERNDCPWEEHARWYPDCRYVILKKGLRFVANVLGIGNVGRNGPIDTTRNNSITDNSTDSTDESIKKNFQKINEDLINNLILGFSNMSVKDELKDTAKDGTNPQNQLSHKREEIADTGNCNKHPSMLSAQVRPLIRSVVEAIAGPSTPSINSKSTVTQNLFNRSTRYQNSTPSIPPSPLVTDALLDNFMKQDISRSVLKLGFPQKVVRDMLKLNLDQKCMPFSSLEQYIEAIFKYSESIQQQESSHNILSPNDNLDAQDTTTGQITITQTSERSVTDLNGDEEDAAGPSTPNTNSTGEVPVNTELDLLMTKDTPRVVLGMGFSQQTVRATLKQKLDQTGLPFTNLETFIESVLQFIENKNRQTLNEHVPELEVEAPQQHNYNRDEPTTIPIPNTITSSESSQTFSSRNEGEAPGQSTPSFHDSGTVLTDAVLESFFELEIPRIVLGMGFPLQTIKTTLKQKWEQTGFPFFTSEPWVEAIIQFMEDNIHQNLHEQESSLVSTLSSGEDEEAMDIDELGNPQPIPSCSSNNAQFSQNQIDELEKIRDIRQCKVCMEAEMDVVFLPCAHMVTCSSCASKLTQCPICRANIRFIIRPIVS